MLAHPAATKANAPDASPLLEMQSLIPNLIRILPTDIQRTHVGAGMNQQLDCGGQGFGLIATALA